ncbi:hypothetical protein NQZ79_g3455 [Umbelopsis isabellina]|nr:hypothetical protein NQZ79_g3455 [Umbelopsis isabellina]
MSTTHTSLTAIALVAMAALVNAEKNDERTSRSPLFANLPTPRTHSPTIEFRLQDFVFEIGMLGFFLAYFAIWYTGASKNVSVAKKWTGAHLDYLKSQFAHIGDGKGNTLVKDGPSDYVLYTSGRRNMQNDVTMILYNLVASLFGFEKAARDHVTVTITLDDNTCEDFVFAVLPQKDSKTLRADRFDLKKFTKVSQTNRLPNSLTVSSESADLTELLLNGRMGEIITEAGDAFNSLVITCYPEYAPEILKDSYPKTATIDFNISEQDTEATKKLVQLVCELPDILSDALRNPRAEIKNKLRKTREEVQKEYAKVLAEERAEELAKKRAEAKRLEEEKVRKLSPAEQRKWEEKERAKELKRSQKKRSKRM